MIRDCPCCNSSDVIALPIPFKNRAMISSGRIFERSLKKAICKTCEYGFHIEPITNSEIVDFYDNDYDLSVNDTAGDKEREKNFATAIQQVACDVQTESVLDIGCGTGMLLAQLSHAGGTHRVVGIEASNQLVSKAKKNLSSLTINKEVIQTFAENFIINEAFDLVVSINAIEHSLNPSAFLKTVAKHLKKHGVAVIITPSGEGTEELLFLDHISTFSPRSLEIFSAGAGLKMTDWKNLDGTASGFQMAVLQKSGNSSSIPNLHQIEGRFQQLESWIKLNERAQADFFQQPFAIFGAGQFTDLIAAYAPVIFDKSKAIVVDNPLDDTYKGKLCCRTKFAKTLNLTHLLLGVHPRNTTKVRNHLVNQGLVSISTAEIAETAIKRRYGVTQQFRTANDTERAFEELKMHGFTLLSSGLKEEELDSIAEDFEQAHKNYHDTIGEKLVAAARETDTVRLMTRWNSSFRKLATNKLLLELISEAMQTYFILNQSNGLINRPHQEYSQASYHRDLPYQHFTSSRPLAINALFCIDDFTLDNGATRVIPGSHLQISFPSDRYVQQHELIVEAPRGSFIVLDAMTYHSGGANKTNKVRRAINHVYTIPMIRQQISLARELIGLDLTDDEKRLFGVGLEEPLSIQEFLTTRIEKS